MRFVVYLLLPLWTVSFSLRAIRQSLSVSLMIAGTFSNPPVGGEVPSKQLNLDKTTIAKIVGEDITLRQALVTADFTRSIYSEDCKFQDEIDTYPIDKYIQGTKALFNADKSHVDLDGPVVVEGTTVSFPFKEKLTFNLPFNPYVYLTGHVDLTRGQDGLIAYSREHWDQSVAEVISHVKF